MIGMNPAFEMVRKHKKVEQETENLVIKLSRSKITQDEMITAFENGIAGKYGKFIAADTQTLMGWIKQFLASKNNSKNYLESGLLDIRTKITDFKYPSGVNDWCMEANKCFTAFLNGVDPINFHPHVYDRMMLDNKVELNAYKKYLPAVIQNEPHSVDEIEHFFNSHITPAKQMILRDVFNYYRSKGWKSVYLIPITEDSAN